MQVITVVNQKGGVGKSTTVYNLGAGLEKQGYKVLMIDLDPQGNLTYNSGTIEILNTMEILKDANKIKELNGTIIRGGGELAGADLELQGVGKEYKLKEALDQLKENFDFILIDTPPTLNILTINGLVCCDKVLIPAQADIFSLQGIGQLYNTIQTVKKYCNSKLEILGIVVTRYNSRTNLSKNIMDLLEDTAKGINSKVYNTKIRECTAVKEAQALQTNIFEYAKNSNATKDYNDLIKEILKDLGNK